MYIGVFDSGVGGLGIFNEIRRLLPEENILYFADQGFFPYGEKKPTEIQKRAEKIVNFYINQKCKIIIIACNTASVTSLFYLRGKFQIPIVGVVPVIKTAASLSMNKKIGILGTEVAISSSYLKTLVDEFAPSGLGYEVFYQSANDLVDLVEKGKFNNTSVIEKDLEIFKENHIDALALGCTHFPFLKNKIQESMGPQVAVLDSNEAVARQVRRILINNRWLERNRNSEYKFFTTGEDSAKFNNQIEMLSKIKNPNIEKINL